MNEAVKPLCVVKFGRDHDNVVATLGDPLASTCSIEFAKTWLSPEGGTILGFASFEDAAAAVAAGGEARYLIVPGAYPEIRNIIFDEKLYLEDTFKDRVPDIVLVRGERPIPFDTPVRLYHHAALRSSVEELQTEWPDTQFITVSSNPVACDRVLEDPQSLALTNIIAANAYGATVLRTMRKGSEMPCTVFRARTRPVPADALRPWTEARPPRRTQPL